MDASSSRWRQHPTQKATDNPTSRKMLLVIVATLFLMVLAAVLALLLYPSPYVRPLFLPLMPFEYQVGIPTRPWARQDIETLLRIGWSVGASAQTSQKRDLILAELNQLRSTSSSVPLVVYLGGYIVRGADDKAYLLPVDGEVDVPASLLPLTEVLAKISRSPARHKLVMLDVMFPLTLPRQGLLRSDIADLIWKDLEQAVENDRKLSILTACSPGQISYASEELGHSVFGYFLYHGLAGKADHMIARKADDGRVTMHELTEYVRECVDRWTYENLQQRQTPVLLGTARDFPLTQSRGVEIEEDHPLPTNIPDWLVGGWKLVDRWWMFDVHRQVPDVYRDLTRVMVQTDQRWRRGVQPDRVKSDLSFWLKRIDRKLRQEIGERDPFESQGVIPVLNAPLDEDELFRLRRLLAERDRLAMGKPTEEMQKRFQAQVEAITKAHKDDPVGLGTLVCDAVSRQSISAESVKLLAEMLEQTLGISNYPEVRFLKKLADRAKQRPEDWSGEVAQLAMNCERQSVLIQIAPEATLKWVSEPLRDAESRRREGAKLLFEVKESWLNKARSLFLDLERKYKEISREINIVQEARQNRDEYRSLLPSFLEAPHLDKQQIDSSTRLVNWVRNLTGILVQPDGSISPERSARIRQMEMLNHDIQNDPNGLILWWRPQASIRFREMLELTKRGRLVESKAEQLLAGPWISTRQRLDIWKIYRSGAQDRHQETMKVLDQLEEIQNRIRALGAWELTAVKAGQDSLLRQDAARARASVLLWQLLSNEENREMEKLAAEVFNRPQEQTGWKKLAAELQRVWKKSKLLDESWQQ